MNITTNITTYYTDSSDDLSISMYIAINVLSVLLSISLTIWGILAGECSCLVTSLICVPIEICVLFTTSLYFWTGSAWKNPPSSYWFPVAVIIACDLAMIVVSVVQCYWSCNAHVNIIREAHTNVQTHKQVNVSEQKQEEDKIYKSVYVNTPAQIHEQIYESVYIDVPKQVDMQTQTESIE